MPSHWPKSPFPARYSTWPLNLPPTEESLEAPPCWSVTYATDGQTPLRHSGSLLRTPHTEPSEPNPPQTTRPASPSRWNKKTLWNSFEFYPTLHPDERPPEGFPKNIMIEFSNTEDFSKILHTEQASAGAIAEMQTGKKSADPPFSPSLIPIRTDLLPRRAERPRKRTPATRRKLHSTAVSRSPCRAGISKTEPSPAPPEPRPCMTAS